MSLEFIDGFDHYGLTNMAQKGWAVSSGGITTPGRFGGQAFNTFGILGGFAAIILPAGSLATRIVGFAFNPGGPANTVRTLDGIIALEDGTGSPNIQLQFNMVNGFITVYRGVHGTGGTLLATATTGPQMVCGIWYYIEIAATIGASGSVQVNISDGAASTTIINITGANTQNTANPSMNRISLLADNGNNTTTNACSYDDLYVCTPTGAVNNTFLGEVRVQTIYPVSDGHAAQWAPNTGSGNFSKVNETLVDDDTTFVSSSTPGQLDSYNHAPLVTPGTIFGVQTNVTARKDDAGARSVAVDVYDGLTDFVNSNAHGMLSGYQDFMDIYETDPSTGVPWTVASFNARQFGVSVVS